MYSLPENIKDFRIMRQLSQKDLANKLNRSVGTIANWEKGVNSPPVEVLMDLSDVLGTSPNELLGWSESEELTAFKKEHEAILSKMEELRQQKFDIDERLRRYAEYISRYSKVSEESSRPDILVDKDIIVEAIKNNKTN